MKLIMCWPQSPSQMSAVSKGLQSVSQSNGLQLSATGVRTTNARVKRLAVVVTALES